MARKPALSIDKLKDLGPDKLAQLVLGTRAVIARLVRQEHDNLLARGAAKATLGAFICYPPAHEITATWVEILTEIAYVCPWKYFLMPLRWMAVPSAVFLCQTDGEIAFTQHP